MKTFKVLLFGLITILLSLYVLFPTQIYGLKFGSCGNKNISIYYKYNADYLSGCEGIKRAKKFFLKYGYTVDTPIIIYFKHEVTINFPGEGIKHVVGCFDAKNKIIYMSSLDSPLFKNPHRVYLRIEKLKGFSETKLRNYDTLGEFHRSMVTHEVAHLLAQHNYNLQFSEKEHTYREMGHGVQEYIASVVQLSTMEPSLLRNVLKQYDAAIIIDNEEQISIILYACDPEIFCIMSYRHFHSHSRSQQQNLLDRILSNNLNPDLHN